MSNNLTYKNSGVDIEKADELVSFIKQESSKLPNKDVISGIGGFASLFLLENFQYKNPVIVSSTDGVGTKILIANEVYNYDFIGIDLVAMCINDLICHGAQPLFFLDYYATGKLDLEISKKIISSIVKGCAIANVSLVGGETAELPGIYRDNDYDLAGFSVGIVERDEILPSKNIKKSDILIGLESSGLHSNGFSLVRNIFSKLNVKYTDVSPWQRKWHEILLEPTKIYVDDILKIKKLCKGVAHITGGGIFENTKRIIPSDLKIDLSYSVEDWPELFKWLQSEGNIKIDEMLKTFNCGIGMVIVANEQNANEILKLPNAKIIGKLI